MSDKIKYRGNDGAIHEGKRALEGTMNGRNGNVWVPIRTKNKIVYVHQRNFIKIEGVSQ